MYEPSVTQVVLSAVVISAVVAGGMAAWSWSRARRRILVGAAAALLAVVLWRIVLTASNGGNMDVDNPVLLGLSAEDVGSGVLTFLLTALPLGLVLDRAATADRVVRAALIAGVAAMVADRFV